MEAQATAVEIFGGDIVSDVIRSPLNGYETFFVAPDGSKEGWEDSNAGDEKREQFLDWVTAYGKFLEVVEVRYGGDDSFSAKVTEIR